MGVRTPWSSLDFKWSLQRFEMSLSSLSCRSKNPSFQRCKLEVITCVKNGVLITFGQGAVNLVQVFTRVSKTLPDLNMPTTMFYCELGSLWFSYSLSCLSPYVTPLHPHT